MTQTRTLAAPAEPLPVDDYIREQNERNAQRPNPPAAAETGRAEGENPMTATLPDTVAAQRARLDELQAERAELGATLERDRADLARLTAEGGSATARDRLRKAIASATERDGEWAEAIPLLERAHAQSADELGQRLAADASVEADRLTEVWRSQAADMLDELTAWARDVFAPKRRAVTASYHAAVHAHREALRLAGRDRYAIRDADERVERRAPLRGEEAQEMRQLMAALTYLAEHPSTTAE